MEFNNTKQAKILAEMFNETKNTFGIDQAISECGHPCFNDNEALQLFLDEIHSHEPEIKRYIKSFDCDFKNESAVNLGRLGGRVKSEAKSKSSAQNGILGGRPKKVNDNKS